MNKKIIKTVVALMFCCAVVFTGCGKGDSDSSGDTTIQFYSWGNETEVEVTRELVKEFNETNKDGITVEFTPIPSGDYETKVTNALRGRKRGAIVCVSTSILYLSVIFLSMST